MTTLQELRDNYDPGYCVPKCKICGGMGWLRKDTDDKNDPEFGQIYPCPNRYLKGWDTEMGIAIEEAKFLNWDKFIQTNAIKQMRKAYDIVLERGSGWIYIHGEPGNGKTIMAKAAAIYARKKLGFRSRYRKLSEIMNDLRSSYDDDFGQIVYQNRLKDWAEVKMLIIDELGRDRKTEFSVQSLSDIMDARYQDAVARQTITVFVSNFSPEEILQQYQIDRVRDGRFEVVQIKGHSVRAGMKQREPTGEEWWNK